MNQSQNACNFFLCKKPAQILFQMKIIQYKNKMIRCELLQFDLHTRVRNKNADNNTLTFSMIKL